MMRIMGKGTVIWVVGLLVGAMLVAGCGDAESDDTQSLTKAEFVQQADAICDRAKKGIEKKLLEGKGTIISNTMKVLRAEAKQIEELEAPSGDERQIADIIDGIDKTIAAVKANPQNVSPANVQLAKAEERASGYGLKSCLLAE